MYTAVRIVKMYAWSSETRTSNKVRNTSMANENGAMTTMGGDGRGRREHREGHEQEVAGEHVGEEPDGQGEGAHEEDRDELDRGHQQVKRLGHARREERAPEVAEEPLTLDADDDEQDVGEERQEQRVGHPGVHRHLDAREHLPDVADEDEEEHGNEQGRELEPLGADRRHDDLLLDHLHRALGDVLHTRRDELALAGRQEEDGQRDRHRDEVQQGDLVELQQRPLAEQRRPLQDLVDGRELQAEQHGYAGA